MDTLAAAGAPGLAWLLATAIAAVAALVMIVKRPRGKPPLCWESGRACEELDRQREAATGAWKAAAAPQEDFLVRGLREWAEAEREHASCR